MQGHRVASGNGREPLVGERVRARSELDDRRVRCRHAEVRLAVDANAPGAARAVVAGRLRERVPAAVFDRVQLLTSELVTNSVLHSDAPAEAALVFRLDCSDAEVRLEVEDTGHHGVVAVRAPDLDRGGGFGLNLVQQLSERWGFEHVTTGGTRVWAHVAIGSLNPHLSTA
jgi:anti-sigma regulatory factor (Ser/Thr protein kinase)